MGRHIGPIDWGILVEKLPLDEAVKESVDSTPSTWLEVQNQNDSEEEIFGPLSIIKIKQALVELHRQKQDLNAINSIYVRPYNSQESWTLLIEHPLFKSKEVNSAPDTNHDKGLQDKHFKPLTTAPSEKEFWFIPQSLGLVQGPFPTALLEVKLEKRQLLYTDLISFDHGKSWMRVCDYQGPMDLPTGQLPDHGIDGELEAQSQEEVRQTLLENKNDLEQGQGLAILAYLEKPMKKISSKILKKIAKVSKNNAKTEREKTAPNEGLLPSWSEYWPWAMLTLALVFGAKSLWTRLGPSKPQSLQTPTANVLKQDLTPAQVESTRSMPRPDLSRPSISKTQASNNKASGGDDGPEPLDEYNRQEFHSPVKRRVPSFRQSKAYQEHQKTLSPEEQRELEAESLAQTSEQDSYPYEGEGNNESAASRAPADTGDGAVYDDGTTPVEQDPVRSKLSRQTLNPDDSFGDEAPIEDIDSQAPPIDPPPEADYPEQYAEEVPVE